jgi:Eco57I restriction-modification methylase
MSAAPLLPLPDPPRGFRYYRSRSAILRAPEIFAYQHTLLRAWDEMHLSGVLTLNGLPTVYLRDERRPVSARVAAEAHLQFWNQGIATILLLCDPQYVRVFSSMMRPADPNKATDAGMEEQLVEKIDLAAQAIWAERFYTRLGTGHYYAAGRETKFEPKETVDAYLLSNLAAVRDLLVVELGLKPQFAHAFLGRLLFTCYLCDREIIELPDYFIGKAWRHVHELLDAFDDPGPALYGTLFPELRREFNGSMFDDDLSAEKELVRMAHFQVVRRFLRGDDLARAAGQRSLGFWAYNFKFIPIETISAIYEKFLEGEDVEGKRIAGAFYTPRFLAEMALDIAVEGIRPLFQENRRFIDPACGSGIFLVMLFSRLAAEWRAAQRTEPTVRAKAEALLDRLDALRGIDKNATACRITCFSLYLAFLDQFDPPHVRAYIRETGQKLPSLLHLQGARRAPEHPVVHEADFFEIAPEWPGQFDLLIGNPPWSGRGTKQIAHQFMEKAPALLKEDGRACLVLPSKVFLNQTDDFQSRWLRAVTLQKVIQLADYRRILFKESRCPCNIVLFTPRKPVEATHEIEYVAPKVSRADLRDGVIQVSPQDRKWIPLRFVLAAAEQKAAGIAWKSRLWGTPRDLKFLDYLFSLPRLDELAGSVDDWKRGKSRWRRGVGFQPLRATGETDKPKSLGSWSRHDRFVSADSISCMPVLPEVLSYELGDYLLAKRYRVDELRRQPEEDIFTPPLVLWNHGFTDAAFFDYKVRYQDVLRGVSGPEADTDHLMFLASFLRSPLARYFVFHTAASLATERDQVHLDEALRLPFFLPDSEAAQPNAASILRRVAAKVRRLKEQMEIDAKSLINKLKQTRPFRLSGGGEGEGTEAKERATWLRRQRDKAQRTQSELNLLIYEYFGINDQERALIEDACEILDKSDTPPSLEAARSIPTLQPIDAAGLEPYAAMLTETLNGWASGSLRVNAIGGVDSELGLGLVELNQVRTPQHFETGNISKRLANALDRLQEASIEQWGPFEFRRSGLVFDLDAARIYLVKPALRGQWTRTTALNDAVDISAHIADDRRKAKAG